VKKDGRVVYARPPDNRRLYNRLVHKLLLDYRRGDRLASAAIRRHADRLIPEEDLRLLLPLLHTGPPRGPLLALHRM
jgi:hypothetical protein